MCCWQLAWPTSGRASTGWSVGIAVRGVGRRRRHRGGGAAGAGRVEALWRQRCRPWGLRALGSQLPHARQVQFSKTDQNKKGNVITCSHRCKAKALPPNGMPTEERCDACGVLALTHRMKGDKAFGLNKPLYTKIVEGVLTTKPLNKGVIIEELRYFWHQACRGWCWHACGGDGAGAGGWPRHAAV